MSDRISARDLMRTEFSRVRDNLPLAGAMAALREAQSEKDHPNALMIVDAEGRFVGMLTAKLLIRILAASDEPGDERDDAALLRDARDRLSTAIGDALILDIPVVTPDDRLLTLIRRGLPTRLDFVPVVEDGQPVGLVPITAIFEAAAAIALTPEHEGIRFDR